MTSASPTKILDLPLIFSHKFFLGTELICFLMKKVFALKTMYVYKSGKHLMGCIEYRILINIGFHQQGQVHWPWVFLFFFGSNLFLRFMLHLYRNKIFLYSYIINILILQNVYSYILHVLYFIHFILILYVTFVIHMFLGKWED